MAFAAAVRRALSTPIARRTWTTSRFGTSGICSITLRASTSSPSFRRTELLRAELETQLAQRKAELETQLAQRKAELEAQPAQRKAELEAQHKAELETQPAQHKAELEAEEARCKAEL